MYKVLKNQIDEALREALANGYQIDPEAFRVLKILADRVNLVDLVLDVIRSKRALVPEELIITLDDVEKALPPDFQRIESVEASTSEQAPVILEERMKVVKDVPPTLSPIEGIEGFERLFRSRFEKLMKIVKQRADAHQIRKIGSARKEAEGVKICGLVLHKRVKRNSVELTIDDDTGSMNIVVVDERTRREASEVMVDQFVMVDVRFSRKGGPLAKAIYSPDIPDHSANRSERNVYVVLTSDLHIGSRTFLVDAFQNFVNWLRGRGGDEEIVRRIKYLVIAGDLVDGIGVYPGQECELNQHDLSEQYDMVIKFLKQIPKYIRIVTIPGNHDSVRQALPQPPIPRRYAEELYMMENMSMLGDPVELNLDGVDLLVYHGRSLDDVIANTPGLTFTKPAAAMKILLKARHLAPIYGGRTSLAPEAEDHLVIENIPDIFHSGHVHTLDAEAYRGTLIVNSGTWQAQTRYQANMGLTPTPAIVPIVNLATLEVMVKDFTVTSESAEFS